MSLVVPKRVSICEVFGCKPWVITKKETCLHAIPGIGLITSAATCFWAEKKVQTLEVNSEAPEVGSDSDDIKSSHCEANYVSLEESREQTTLKNKQANRRVMLICQLALYIGFALAWPLTSPYR